MEFSDNAMSAILLCSYIGIKKDDAIKPLSLGEWSIFLRRIIEKNLEPSIVLESDLRMLSELNYNRLETQRISSLVSRGGAVAFELDNLSSRGIDIVTIFDENYPVLLKRKLKRKAPPILYYAGDIKLANNIGIAVVGSRNVDQEGIEFTKELVRRASKERLVIYSGGAKGVDTISENAAIQNGSAVVSFVADSVLTRIKKKENLNHIIQGKLLLISDVKPDVGFSAARAMNRNKYIYAAAYGAFVIASDYNTGGTWSGAVENIRNEWTKEFVWNHRAYNGNLKLIERGGIPYELSEENIYDSITRKENSYNQLDIFNLSAVVNEEAENYSMSENKNQGNSDNTDIYDIVKNFIIDNIGDGLEIDQASNNFNVAKGQMKEWMKRLCDDKILLCERGVYYKKQ